MRSAAALLALGLAPGALLLSSAPARAVQVDFQTLTFGAYAATYVFEDWGQAGPPPTSSGSLENTEQVHGASTISSVQKVGLDASGSTGECTPPCTGMTAQATARFVGGGISLSALSHSYANFDQITFLGTPPNTYPAAGYKSGNVVRAEASAAVWDLLHVTAPVTIDSQLHVTGSSHYTYGSLYDGYASQLADVEFGSGRSRADVFVTITGIGLGGASFQALFQTSVDHDRVIAGSATLPPGDYLLEVQLKTYTGIGNFNRPTIGTQDMLSDFSHTLGLRLTADDPSALSSETGLLRFTPVPEPSTALLEAAALITLALRARHRRSAPART